MTLSLRGMSTSKVSEECGEDADPFCKIRQLIQGLIGDLEEQKSNEANQHEWCKEQMDTLRSDKQSTKTDKLNAESAQSRALENKRQLEKTIAELGAEIQTLQAAKKEKTELHNE